MRNRHQIWNLAPVHQTVQFFPLFHLQINIKASVGTATNVVIRGIKIYDLPVSLSPNPKNLRISNLAYECDTDKPAYEYKTQGKINIGSYPRVIL